MDLKYRFLLKEINATLNMQNREAYREKLLEEIAEYSKTESGMEFLTEMAGDLTKFTGFFMGNTLAFISTGEKLPEPF